MTASCIGPGAAPDKPCGRPTVALDLCTSHYSQHSRGRPLTPLRKRSPPGQALVMLSIRVTPECLAAVRAAPGAARDHLETWARRPKKGKP